MHTFHHIHGSVGLDLWCSTVISWQSVLLVECPEKTTDLSVASHWQTLSHNVVSPGWDSNSQR